MYVDNFKGALYNATTVLDMGVYVNYYNLTSNEPANLTIIISY
jgi:hypothetical protein